MKKLLSLLAVVLMALSLVACSKSEETADDSSTDSDMVTITVGMSPDYPPYESLDTNGNLVGFEVEMLNEMETLLSQSEGKTYKFDIVQMSFDNIITQIQGKQLNIGVSGFTWSEDRVGAVAFSEPYANSKQVMLVLADSTYTSSDDLQGQPIAGQTGTTGYSVAVDTFGEENVTSVQNLLDMIPGLDSHQYEAIVTDSGVAENYAATGNYKVLDESLVDEQNYIVVDIDDEDTLAIINNGIELFMASDKYGELCETYGLSKIEG